MSLFRACSGWPSGVWIDGDRRTAPDGSSFAWQHWSHTFCYALAVDSARPAAGGRPGSTRPPRSTTTTCAAVVTAARLAASPGDPDGLLSVDGRAQRHAVGASSPSATRSRPGGRGRRPARPREVTVRLRETDGRAAVARLRLAAGIEAAWRERPA